MTTTPRDALATLRASYDTDALADLIFTRLFDFTCFDATDDELALIDALPLTSDDDDRLSDLRALDAELATALESLANDELR